MSIATIGAGALAEYVATMALFNDFAVTVCDPRIEHRGTWTVAGVALSTEMPDDAVRTLNPDPRTCIIALSHDPKLDDPALHAALASSAFYIGALGSRRAQSVRLDRLREAGFSDDDLARIHAPVGLDIGARTPGEIAAAILAEIVRVLRADPSASA
mgnify:CR=1 FL=1